MADEDPTQVLDYLRECARLHSRLDRMERALAEHARALDNLSERLARIERRLDLVEG